ncbi:MAG: undecaprenyl-diphosphate phosphatase [Candidatus Marinamargulisbacteria bacterium]
MVNMGISVIILGVIEGLTEFLPISSTGHLILMSKYLGLEKSFYEVFDVAIQLGAILAVLRLYPGYFKQVCRQPLQQQNQGMLLALMPICTVGFLFRDIIKEVLFAPLVIFWGLIIGGLGLIFMERWVPYSPDERDQKESVTARQAFLIGIVQCLALWPGMSRSAMSMIGGMLAGLNRVTAASYSFIIAVPLILITVVYDVLASAPKLTFLDMIWMGIGSAVSYGVAYLTMAWFLRLIARQGLYVFGVYRIILGMTGLIIF